MAYVHEHGVGDLSLRQLAAAVGTSHRMLIYHFGSKEALLVAVVRAQEAQERAEMGELLRRNQGASDEELMRAMWKRFTAPRLRARERLFFELYGQALQGRPGTEALLEGIVHDWLDAVGAARPDRAARMRLDIAVVRGLLLDLLATEDRAGVDAAFEQYLNLARAATASDPAAR